MSHVAYRLTAEHSDTYVGGVLAVGTGSLDVAEELAKGGGRIEVPIDDTLTQAVLDGYPPLERVPDEPAHQPADLTDEQRAPLPELAGGEQPTTAGTTADQARQQQPREPRRPRAASTAAEGAASTDDDGPKEG